MADYTEAFVAFDVAKLKHAVAVADSGRSGEVRFLGEIENRPAAIERAIKKLGKSMIACMSVSKPVRRVTDCIGRRDLGHDCMVVAPALMRKRSGEPIKTNRRDAVTLARLHRRAS